MITTVARSLTVSLDVMLLNETFALAYSLWSEGFSVIPLSAYSKRPVLKWKPYQTEQCTLDDLVEWFYIHNHTPAIVTGFISGVIAIDCDDADAIDTLIEAGVESDVFQRTSRGIHFIFRWDREIRNTVRLLDSKIDRRGDGGYIKAYKDSFQWSRKQILMAPSLPELVA